MEDFNEIYNFNDSKINRETESYFLKFIVMNMPYIDCLFLILYFNNNFNLKQIINNHLDNPIYSIKYIVKITSFLNGLILFISNYLYLYHGYSNELYYFSILTLHIHFNYDLLIILNKPNKYSSTPKIFFIHHIIGKTFMYVLYHHNELVARPLLAEITNSFLFLSWYMKENNYYKSSNLIKKTLYFVNLFLFFLTYTYIRIYLWTLDIFYYYYNSILGPIGFIISLTALLINYMWYYKLLKMIYFLIYNNKKENDSINLNRKKLEKTYKIIQNGSRINNLSL